MDFLPADYQAPKSASDYFKMQEGENRIRIMSRPILGWEDWHDKKPVRYMMDQKPPKPYDIKKPIKHFWAFVVFNYNEEKIQVMNVTQSTIRKSLEALCKDADWGAPYYYDIKIIKTGEGVETEYTVNPIPHKQIDPYLIECFYDKPCNLSALYSGEDPFSPGYHPDCYATLAVDAKKSSTFESPKEKPITAEEMEELKSLFDGCTEVYQQQLIDTLATLPKPVFRLEDIPPALFPKVQAAVFKNHTDYQLSKVDF